MTKQRKSPEDRSANIGKDATGSVIVTGDGNVVHVDRKDDAGAAGPQDPHKYLRDLQANSSFIDSGGNLRHGGRRLGMVRFRLS